MPDMDMETLLAEAAGCDREWVSMLLHQLEQADSLRPLTWDVLRRARQNAERHNDGCICPRCRDA